MRHRGFTLVELVVMLLIVAVVAVATMPRWFGISRERAVLAARRLKSDLELAQNLAMTANIRYRMRFFVTPLDYYDLVNDADGDGTWGEAGETAADPATQETFQVNLNTGDFAGVIISAADFSGTTGVEFDTVGTPYNTAGAALVPAGTNAVTLSGGGVTRRVVVAAGTGKVELQ